MEKDFAAARLLQILTSLKVSNWEGEKPRKEQSTREGSDWSTSGHVSSPRPIIVAGSWDTMIDSTWSHGLPVL